MKGNEVSTQVKIDFSDGRKFLWDMDDEVGSSVLAMMITRIGAYTASRVPLRFEPLENTSSCYIAETNNYTYVILVREYGSDVCLYQMPANQPFCPVNAQRADRFRRFDAELGDAVPLLGTAAFTAQEWDDEVNMWDEEADGWAKHAAYWRSVNSGA